MGDYETAVQILTADRVSQWRSQARQQALLGMAELPKSAERTIIRKAEKSLEYTWPDLKREEYEMFSRTGNRSVFQVSVYQRRDAVKNLVMGELVEGKGRFIPQIIKGIKATMNQNTWVLPAHLGKPWTEDKADVVDIFSAQLGCDLAWVALVLGDKLDKAEKGFSDKLRSEIRERILVPALKKEFWWNRGTNNWNVWVCCNWLQCLLICDDDIAFRKDSLKKMFTVCDRFINAYPEDGGCDEGPGYWNVAGGILIRMAGVLKDATADKVDLFARPLIREMSRYILYAHVDGRYFTNFADCSPVIGPKPVLMFMGAANLKDNQLKDFAVYMRDLLQDDFSETDLCDMAWYHRYKIDLDSRPGKAPYLKKTWLPDLQVMTARSHEGTAKGLYVAVRGGHNDESHNHNDVGHFMVYVDGLPAIIDVGWGTYTKQTGSRDRYKLWYMSSDWHNLPTINGVVQGAGRNFKAQNVSVKSDQDGDTMALDIAAAYPAEARVKAWVRTVGVNNKKGLVSVQDDFELTAAVQPPEWSFVTHLAVDAGKPGVVRLSETKGGKTILTMTYDNATCAATVEEKDPADDKIAQMWTNGVRRILITAKGKPLSGKFLFEMKQAE